MSKVRLLCDICGGTFKDKYTKVLCDYCQKKERQDDIEDFSDILRSIEVFCLGEEPSTIRNYVENRRKELEKSLIKSKKEDSNIEPT